MPGTKTPMKSSRKSTLVSFVLENLFRVCEDIFQVFFLSTISSVLTFGCVCWGARSGGGGGGEQFKAGQGQAGTNHQ